MRDSGMALQECKSDNALSSCLPVLHVDRQCGLDTKPVSGFDELNGSLNLKEY